MPAHRKVNRVDMGTADKVCAVALAIHEQAERHGCSERDVSFILLELGGAFTAAIAVERGRIVDGVGGTSGPLGLRGAGALDGEVAFLAGPDLEAPAVHGRRRRNRRPTRGCSRGDRQSLIRPRAQLAWDAYLESAVKAVAALAVSAPEAREVMLSGRLARVAGVRETWSDAFSRQWLDVRCALPRRFRDRGQAGGPGRGAPR